MYAIMYITVKEMIVMMNTTATTFRKNLFSLLDNAIRLNETININTKNGNAIVISEDEYNDLMETLYLSSSPKTKKEIIKGLNTPLDECISDDEVVW